MPYNTYPYGSSWSTQYPHTTPSYSPYQSPVNGLIRVTGIEGAKAYQLPPNSNAVLFDGEEPLFYLKSTDGAGFPTIRTFRFEEVQPQAPSIDTSQYVSRAEFDKLVERIESYAQSDIPEQQPKSRAKQHLQSIGQSKADAVGQS